jgi:PAS domain S-box-containing protein
MNGTKSDEDLIGELIELCKNVTEIGASLLIRQGRLDLVPGASEDREAQVSDFRWWAERASRLETVRPADLTRISEEDAVKLIRELQISQVEVRMQNEELQRVQEELKESRDKYSDLYDLAPVGYFSLSEDSLVLEVNQTAARMLGRAKEDLIGKPFSAHVPKEEYATYYGHLRDVLGTRTRQTCELELERSSSSRFFARFESIAVRGKDGDYRECKTVMSDVSDVKRAEAALRESEELHRVTLSSISDTVLITDSNGAFTYVCPNVHVIFGYSDDEVRALQNVESLLGAAVFEPSQLAHTNEIENIERSITDKHGNRHVLWINVKKVNIKGGTLLYSCRDVTALRRAQQALGSEA